MLWFDNTKSYLYKHPFLLKALYIFVCSLPILIVVLPYLVYRNRILPADWDYFAQMYEAFRSSVLQYHQFPWFNPWVAGGVPLFANPQFGLFSVQSITVLLFGTLHGLRLAVVVYVLLGFWGMYVLLRYINCNPSRSILLGYVFALGGYGIYHLTGGHLTFAIYYLAPWILWSLLRLVRSGSWLAFALITSLCLQTASHYSVIQILLLVAMLSILALVFLPYSSKRRMMLISFAKAGALILCLNLPKLFFNLQYLRDYPRLANETTWLSFKTIILAFLTPPSPAYHITQAGYFYAWGEYSAYCGTFFAFCFLLICGLVAKKKGHLTEISWAALAVIIISLTLALGNFAKFSPYHLLAKLPVFSSMLVPSRWLGWAFVGMVIFVGSISMTPKLEKVVKTVLVLAVLEIGFFTMRYIQFMAPQASYITPEHHTEFEQYDNLPDNGRMRYLQETQSNLGEVRGYEAILGYDLMRPTNRCGINNGCEFVITHNAEVTYWSPNKITLQRTGDGPIKLNLNPGSYWVVNGRRLWPNMKVVELTQDFVLDDGVTNYSLIVRPSVLQRFR